MWTMPDLKPVRTLWGHTDAVRTVAFSPDRQYLATGGAQSARRDTTW